MTRKNHGNIAPHRMPVPVDPRRTHSTPCQWGSTSFSVNRDVCQGVICSLATVFDPPPELRARINVLDSQEEVLIPGSLCLGLPQCIRDRAQLQAPNDRIRNARQNWASFGLDIAKGLLVSGDAAAVTNCAASTSDVTGVEPYLDAAIRTSPGNTPPRASPPAHLPGPATRKRQSFTTRSGPT